MGSQHFSIRLATLTDIQELTVLFDGYRMFYQQPSDIAHAREFLTERINNQESVVFIAVNKNGTGLGFVQLYPAFSSVAMRKSWILNDLFVSEVARQHGVAEALMNHAKEFGKGQGALRITLQTHHENTQAQALYNKLGYKQNSDFYQFSLPLGN